MTNTAQYILSTKTQLIFETVMDGKQGVSMFENGENIFLECSLKQIIASNEKYYATNLQSAKKFAKDILGTTHAAPYFFMDLVLIPMETYNRSVILYLALHHFKELGKSNRKNTLLGLTHGVNIHLNISESAAIRRIGRASILKEELESRKNCNQLSQHHGKNCWEIVKDQGSIYFTGINKDGEY